MNKLVPKELGTFLCMQITDNLVKFLNNSFGSKAVFEADLSKFIIMIIIIITMN